LASTSARYAVFLPVDLPLLPPSLIGYLLHHARITGRAVTVPTVAGFDQTFPVVLDRALLPALKAALSQNQSSCRPNPQPPSRRDQQGAATLHEIGKGYTNSGFAVERSPGNSGFLPRKKPLRGRKTGGIRPDSVVGARSVGCLSAFQAAAASIGQPISRVAVELLAQSGQVTHPLGLPPVRWFLNLNTPGDVEQAEALSRSRIA
jgi:molybdopterin-guanine dinucleotide biosynthesis protein A